MDTPRGDIEPNPNLGGQALSNAAREKLGDKPIQGKRHTDGCMHSTKPDMVIVTTVEEAANAIMEAGGTPVDDLSTSLYFKHCDGSYKNIRGQELMVGSQG